MNYYIIGLKSQEYFYVCGGGIDLNIAFLTKNPQEAAKTNDIQIANKLINTIFRKVEKFVDLNCEWDQANDFENTIALDLVIKKKDFAIFTFKYIVEEVK